MMPLRDRPSWLEPGLYDFMYGLDAAGWHRHVSLRRDWRSHWSCVSSLPPQATYYFDGSSNPQEDFSAESFWERYTAEVFPAGALAAPSTLGTSGGQMDAAGCKDVKTPANIPSDVALTAGKCVAQAQTRYFAVDLDAPDAQIITAFAILETTPPADGGYRDLPVFVLYDPRDLPYDFEVSDSCRVFTDDEVEPAKRLNEFQSQLESAREEYGAAFRRRGARNFNDTFVADHSRKWRQYHVLTVLDLDLYFRIRRKPRPSYAELWRWLGPGNIKDGKDWGRQARRATKHARAHEFSLEYAQRAQSTS